MVREVATAKKAVAEQEAKAGVSAKDDGEQKKVVKEEKSGEAHAAKAKEAEEEAEEAAARAAMPAAAPAFAPSGSTSRSPRSATGARGFFPLLILTPS